MTTNNYVSLIDSRFITISGDDRKDYLQGIITNDINNADYIVNNYRDWRGITLPNDFITPKNFEIFHEIKVDNISINTIYKKH